MIKEINNSILRCSTLCSLLLLSRENNGKKPTCWKILNETAIRSKFEKRKRKEKKKSGGKIRNEKFIT